MKEHATAAPVGGQLKHVRLNACGQPMWDRLPIVEHNHELPTHWPDGFATTCPRCASTFGGGEYLPRHRAGESEVTDAPM